MRGMRLGVSGMAALLGGVGLLGFSSAAWATSPPCGCSVQNARVEPADSCLRVTPASDCSATRVSNDCGARVTLVDWPLADGPCSGTNCAAELAPGTQSSFYFADVLRRGESTSTQDAYRVKVGDGEEQTLTVFADIVCPPVIPMEDEGCASAPGALAALGVMLLAVPVVRRRRGG